MHTHTKTHKCISTYTFTHENTHTQIFTPAHTHTHTRTHTHMHTQHVYGAVQTIMGDNTNGYCPLYMLSVH